MDIEESGFKIIEVRDNKLYDFEARRKFEQQITKYIKAGWKLHGELKIKIIKKQLSDEIQYIQALVKY
jgi:hypothetical protein